MHVVGDDDCSPQYFAAIFVVITLVAGFSAYRVVKDRDGTPDPVDALVGAKK